MNKLEENLWCVTVTLPVMGLKRVMTLVRIEDGSFVVSHGQVITDRPAAVLRQVAVAL
jgi:hypothetical protein